MNEAQKDIARGFFHELDVPHGEEILMGMDIVTMLQLISFGKEYSKETQQEAIRVAIVDGNKLLGQAIAKDVTIIQKNLNALEMGYKLAMN